MYWLASLVGMTAAVSLARLLLIQVRKLLEEVAGVVRTWRTVRRDLALHRGSAEGRVCRPESQAASSDVGPGPIALVRLRNSRETRRRRVDQPEASVRNDS